MSVIFLFHQLFPVGVFGSNTTRNPWPPPIQNLQEKGYAAESQRLMYFGGELEETSCCNSQGFEAGS